MIKYSILATIVLLAFFGRASALGKVGGNPTPVNGGSACLACTVLVTLTEELGIVYNETIDRSLERLCDYLPQGIFQLACQEAIETFGPLIIVGIYEKESSDVICHALGICHTDPGQSECHVFPKPKNGRSMSIAYQADMLRKKLSIGSFATYKLPKIGGSLCDNKIFKKICEFFDKIFVDREPAVDNDRDGHSTFTSLRGTSWRGRDCNDLSANIHPGAVPINNDLHEDSNCNGIFGQAPDSSKSYEELFCKDSGQLGVAVFGESMSAHYHIPEEWFDATKLSRTVFEHLLFILENEMDWPQLSAITGYMNSTWSVTHGPTRSVYNYLWNRNKCNFRDYQSIAVNGADTNLMLNYMKTLVRDQQKDQPMIVFYSLIGDDICNGFPDTFNHMTPPEVFQQNVIKSMEYLDTRLPKGSHVLLTGLANGSLLYETLGDRVYPLGRVRGDIKYSDFYTYESCLNLSPCNAWMTTNATVRKMATDYAVELSSIVKNVTLTQKYKNFDMAFSDFPIYPVIEKWKAQGGEIWQLIEPIDGFHMNQIANAMVADEYWNFILTEHPDWVGKENPNNDQITKIFGEQGGY